MTKTSLTIEQIPRRVKAFGRLMSLKYTLANTKWRNGNAYEDEWHSYGDYDLNLYCEDGYLSVCAYPETQDEDGFTMTDHSQFVHLVRKGNIR